MFDLLILGIAFFVCMLIAFPVVMGARGGWRFAARLGGEDPILFGGTFVLACVLFLFVGGDLAQRVSIAQLDVMQFLRWRFGP